MKYINNNNDRISFRIFFDMLKVRNIFADIFQSVKMSLNRMIADKSQC